ncbi:hypothetical protein AN963_13090 [Brevibacillus choshinensis]|uniref:Uncharacterized protein n=1 Tax=Brevibacillus choshinensis TaxID=54911 RepID=A0ABR5N5Q2_BRECH|nr:hypothetical protein AN963_13090 [Brevibacillus choshinensis]
MLGKRRWHFLIKSWYKKVEIPFARVDMAQVEGIFCTIGKFKFLGKKDELINIAEVGRSKLLWFLGTFLAVIQGGKAYSPNG